MADAENRVWHLVLGKIDDLAQGQKDMMNEFKEYKEKSEEKIGAIEKTITKYEQRLYGWVAGVGFGSSALGAYLYKIFGGIAPHIK
jgi:uncharacterized protein YceH (UPF0502 family)